VVELRAVLELGVERCKQSSFSQYHLVQQRHQLSLQVLASLGKELPPVRQEVRKEGWGDRAAITKALPGPAVEERRERLAILDSSRRQATRQEFPQVSDEQGHLLKP